MSKHRASQDVNGQTRRSLALATIDAGSSRTDAARIGTTECRQSRPGTALQVHKPEVEKWHGLHCASSVHIGGASACAGVALIGATGKDGPACDCVHRQSPKSPVWVEPVSKLSAARSRRNFCSSSRFCTEDFTVYLGSHEIELLHRAAGSCFDTGSVNLRNRLPHSECLVSLSEAAVGSDRRGGAIVPEPKVGQRRSSERHLNLIVNTAGFS
jgi:hypothetical protein